MNSIVFSAPNSLSNDTNTFTLPEAFLQVGQPSWICPMSQNISNFQTRPSLKTPEEEIGEPCLSSTLKEKEDSVSVMSLSQAICISIELTENISNTYYKGKYSNFILFLIAIMLY